MHACLYYLSYTTLYLAFRLCARSVCDVQSRCSCSCGLWRYVSVYLFNLLSQTGPAFSSGRSSHTAARRLSLPLRKVSTSVINGVPNHHHHRQHHYHRKTIWNMRNVKDDCKLVASECILHIDILFFSLGKKLKTLADQRVHEARYNFFFASGHWCRWDASALLWPVVDNTIVQQNKMSTRLTVWLWRM